MTTLAENLKAPEGVAIGKNPTEQSAPTIYVTESNIQFVRIPSDLETGITAISATGHMTQISTQTPMLNRSTIAFWSYAGLTTGPGGQLYVTNELSRQKITRQVILIPGILTYTATLLTNDSVFAVDPGKGTRELVASNLLSPEGLSFSVDGDFPLYVAEENVGYQGRLSRIERAGQRTTVCSSFRGIEDVAVDTNGDLYVSEDKSGFVVRIEGSATASSTVHPPLYTPEPTTSSTTVPNASPSRRLVKHLWKRIGTLIRHFIHLFR